MHLSNTLFKEEDSGKQECLKKALKILEHSQHSLRGKRVTFICGDSGVLSMLTVLYSKMGLKDKSEKCFYKLLSLSDNVCRDHSLPDEVLYGRAGYLFSLLFVQKHLGEEKISASTINQVCQAILDSGERLAKHERSRSPLMYTWHHKHYVGAAHGIVGILFMLLQTLSTHSVKSNLGNIESCVEFLMSEQFSSGNFPSSLENDTDKLIHWCHGAPGAVHLMVKAYQTGDSRYLHHALKFAEWCFDYGEHGCRTPDRPYSLFEGMAGTVYFLADILEPHSSKFPAFE
ncbi:lanC-like protein 2 isoform X2 [Stylophora pistillata]|uniref:lanC-like protein 2 isoform X2 n=1 Tax=Stylophora pistillata TaxID=50429 RepID=UPI000C055584|nr:lanC-like protein 2 isoform X2 [Stylophora pistillata]